MLGHTIALDIKGGWWTRWWRRKRSYQAFAEEFRALIDAEVAPMVDGLRADVAAPFKAALTSQLEDFIAAQRKVFLGLAGRSQADLAQLRQQQAQSLEEQDNALRDAQSILIEFSRPDNRRTAT
jgi:hypothetical protein